jgi:hypothetical protein
LRGTESEKVVKIRIEANGTAANPRVEERIDARTAAKRSIHELANPASVARIEIRRPFVERRIEQIPTAKIRADLGRGDARVGNGAALNRDAAPASRMAAMTALICTWHTS